jgi:hypothetical protein
MVPRMPFQLWLGDITLPALIDRIAEGACAVAPDLTSSRAREIADLIFRTHVHQTVACAKHGVCSDTGPAAWGGRGRLPITVGTTRPCQLSDADSKDLPKVFAVAAANAMLSLGSSQRDALEERLATVFRQVLVPYLFENEQCGHAPVCHEAPSDPFERVP